MPLAALALHFTLTTASARARDDFSRGMFLVYAYNADAAYAAFADAVRSDPDFAMAYAGEALAVGPNLNQPLDQSRFAEGKAAMADALQRRSNASDQERAYIDAIAKRYQGSWPDDAAHDADAYRHAMAALAARYPDDDDAQVLAAEALMESGNREWRDGRPADANDAEALGLIEGVLARDTSNVMANHLCIHLYDAAPDRAPALACAQTLDGQETSPQAEHLAHMPAHYWIETGDYVHAVMSSQRAYALISQLPPDDPHRKFYEEHDAYVGYSAAMMRFDYDSAIAWAKHLEAAAPAQGNAFEIATMLRFGRNADAFAAAATSPAASESRAVAALRLGNRAAADRIVSQVGAQGLDLVLAAAVAEARGEAAEARADLQALERRQHEIFESELIPSRPAEEMLGGFDLRAGNVRSAERSFRDALERYPNDPWALFGLAAALEREGQAAEAAAARAQLAEQGGDASFLRVEDL